MHKKFMMLALSAVATAVLVAPTAASANHNGSHTGACAFTGLAGNISPGVMLVGGQGGYQFQSTAGSTSQCRMDSNGPAAATIQSTGNFRNAVCGTGTAWSGYSELPNTAADSTTIDINGSPTEITSATYTIEFVGTNGTLDIHTVNGGPENLATNGRVQIAPTTGSCNSPTGVTAFTVAGSFAAEWTD